LVDILFLFGILEIW